jgi:hypothetical protein
MRVEISAQISVYILLLCKVSLKYTRSWYILSYNSLLLSFLTGHSEHNYWSDILHSSDTGKGNGITVEQ